MAQTDNKKGKRSQWMGMIVTGMLTIMLCLTINYSAFSELNKETIENRGLEQRIENITSENLGLQEHIHFLKNDPGTIEREVRKFGLRRPTEKVSVPANK